MAPLKKRHRTWMEQTLFTAVFAAIILALIKLALEKYGGSAGQNVSKRM